MMTPEREPCQCGGPNVCACVPDDCTCDRCLGLSMNGDFDASYLSWCGEHGLWFSPGYSCPCCRLEMELRELRGKITRLERDSHPPQDVATASELRAVERRVGDLERRR